eukprot:CAMPEP_0183335334 /NCGR_PEP_ID=MMETSP0164_2-20130417/3671_1 /TAXON_ID=221442 /ORGANISM="Coccolithus pelagicus ssp braarudi, Strain PLY182g" /LENGTH=133 /DNA_ID=CAMNT_0025504683 /DNA_START=465 /DNA_END=867 /DNA_ORIENTATION=+
MEERFDCSAPEAPIVMRSADAVCELEEGLARRREDEPVADLHLVPPHAALLRPFPLRPQDVSPHVVRLGVVHRRHREEHLCSRIFPAIRLATYRLAALRLAIIVLNALATADAATVASSSAAPCWDGSVSSSL